jgi:large subunit ribosomal protein L10
VPTQAKLDALAELKQRLTGVKTAVLAEYRGLTVRQLSELRKQLRGASAECRIVKNRIAKLAIAGSPLDGLASHLKGPTAIVFSARDPVAVAKTLHTFGKTNQQLLVKAGFVDGQLLPATELRRLADLPSRDALRGQLVATLQGPLAQLAGLLRAPLRDLVSVLDQRSASLAKKEE